MNTAAIFFDRDGVLVENRDEHILTLQDVELIEGAVEAIRTAADAGFKLALITNQGCIGRGLIEERAALDLNRKILALLDSEDRFDGVYLCPHAPADDCSCRKPKPGMLLRAISEHSLDPERCYMIGDALTDIEAANAAGVKGILVLTGRGRAQQSMVSHAGVNVWAIAQNVLEAVRMVTGEEIR